MIRGVLAFARDVLHTFTWQKVLLAQLLAVMLDVFAVLLFVYGFNPPASFMWARVVIEETMALSILFAILIGDQAVARGTRPFRTYALAILLAALFSTVVQHEIRGWLHLYTNADQPGASPNGARTQMIYAACDTLTYGVLFTLVYLDHRRRDRLLRRVRAAELERARREQHIVRSQLAALRTDVNAVELLATLDDLRRGFDDNRSDVDTRLDAVIADLRNKLAPVGVEQEARA